MGKFNEEKATQAAAQFLALAGGRLNYMFLIKLLYMLDREALLRWGRPVTNDHYVSLKYGPVLSSVHDLITEMPLEGETFSSKHISDPSHYIVQLNSNPGYAQLSEAEEDLIAEL